MGVISFNVEHVSSLAPEKLFKAVVLDYETLLPKVLPQSFKNIQTLNGDGGVGSHMVYTFAEGNQVKNFKYRVDELDKQNLVYKYTVIDGDLIKNEHLESISAVVKVEPSGNGGSVWKTTETYHSKGGVQINEEHLKDNTEQSKLLLKAFEAYVQANPNY